MHPIDKKEVIIKQHFNRLMHDLFMIGNSCGCLASKEVGQLTLRRLKHLTLLTEAWVDLAPEAPAIFSFENREE